jgi:trk system potassium uptake protein TrkA
MKQVAVLGLGDFGAALARQLKRNRVSVFAVDISRNRVEAFRDELEHLVIADFTQASALEKLNLTGMDAVVVATSSPMSSSILSVLRLKELGVERIIAKAENEDHAKVLQALGVSEIVNPDEDSAARIANKISWANVVEMIELFRGYSIMEVSPPPAVIGKSLRHSGLRYVYHVEVLGIREKPGGPLHAIPSPDDVITPDCMLVVFGADEHLTELRKEGA